MSEGSRCRYTGARLFLLFVLIIATLSASGCVSEDDSGGAWGEPTSLDDPSSGPARSTTSTTTPKPSPARLAEARELGRRICSECHGMRDQDFEEVTPPGRGNHPEWKEMRNGWIQIGPRSRESWERSVKRMVEVDSAVISKRDQELIVDWLAEDFGPE